MARINRTLKRHGNDVTVIRFIENGEDEYGDKVWRKEETETKAIPERAKQPEKLVDAAGEQVAVSLNFYIDDSIEVDEAAHSERPSRIIRAVNDKPFRVLTAFNEGNGILRCEAAMLT